MLSGAGREVSDTQLRTSSLGFREECLGGFGSLGLMTSVLMTPDGKEGWVSTKFEFIKNDFTEVDSLAVAPPTLINKKDTKISSAKLKLSPVKKTSISKGKYRKASYRSRYSSKRRQL